MVPAPVKVAGCVFLTVWGGLCAALIGLVVYHSIVDLAASIWPRRFPRTVHRRQRADLKKCRRLIRKLDRLNFNRTRPDCYSEACKNAIEEILTGGPDYFARNGIRPPQRPRRKPSNRKDRP